MKTLTLLVALLVATSAIAEDDPRIFSWACLRLPGSADVCDPTQPSYVTRFANQLYEVAWFARRDAPYPFTEGVPTRTIAEVNDAETQVGFPSAQTFVVSCASDHATPSQVGCFVSTVAPEVDVALLRVVPASGLQSDDDLLPVLGETVEIARMVMQVGAGSQPGVPFYIGIAPDSLVPPPGTPTPARLVYRDAETFPQLILDDEMSNDYPLQINVTQGPGGGRCGLLGIEPLALIGLLLRRRGRTTPTDKLLRDDPERDLPVGGNR